MIFGVIFYFDFSNTDDSDKPSIYRASSSALLFHD